MTNCRHTRKYLQDRYRYPGYLTWKTPIDIYGHGYNDWPLVSEYARLQEWLANPYFRRLLRHISVASTPTESTCVLYDIYAVYLQFQGESASPGLINNFNKTSAFRPSVTMTCDLILAKPTMNNSV